MLFRSIFLDIHLSDGLCFKIFEQIEVHIPIIFTTAYDQYAIRAFQVNSVDYLLKPINKKDLITAIDKYKQVKENYRSNQPDLLELLKSFQQKKTYQKRFLVSKGEHIVTINTDNVSYFFADGKYVFLTTKGGVQHVIDYTLDNLEEILDPEVFFRANRKFLICVQSIEQIITLSKSKLKVKLIPDISSELIVSSERSRSFKNWLNK